ncbi:hydantoinase B/oxoprolinase family protein [Marinivivus vitaminiproducens]|uniref:hydantoinase B/oxoprolinase family protein n=1 Tax=Marinivivus vitaminiproducens TaxID=3035935 RepID=UPI0027A91338|nr:hydantoinase B/oxoprolinase family protein [Geminicoccaceae bacterium SCSIO 64248]
MTAATTNTGVDPITAEVIRNKLDGIANEMQLTLVRSAFSAIVKEGLDASAAMFTVKGETLAQALSIPIHLGALVPMVRHLLAEIPLDAMNEGDVYAMNDPYLGGTHIPDIAVMMPVFHGGRPIAICATITHHQDMGGMAPGSTPTNATEIFQEGLRLPLIKLRDRDRMNETFMAILRRNVRIPDIVVGDLIAEISSGSIGTRRLSELADHYGGDFIMSVFDALLDRSEQMTRDALRSIPDGTYTYVDSLDNDGVDLDRRIPIQVAVRIHDGMMEVDFEGTSPQVRGPFNCVPSGSFAAASFAVRAVTDPDQLIPNNGGCVRPLKLKLPEGSIVNPREPAPVGCRTATIKRITSAMLGALRKAVPERVPADTGNEEVILHFGGRRADGSGFVTSQILIGGNGASVGADGTDVIETDATNCMNIPAEALEMEAPIRVHRASLAPDSGGPGRHRGGLGARLEYEILEGEVTITYRGERHFCTAAGAAGGMAGGCSLAEIRKPDGTADVIQSKAVARMVAGEWLVIQTAGGGGHGSVDERTREHVKKDIEDGKVSQEAAASIYRHA